MRTSETTSAVFDAIVKANGLLSAVKKDKRANAGSFSYAYASLDTVIDHVHVALMENGLAVVQEAVSADAPGFVGVTTRLVHRSGEWVEYGPLFLPGGKDAQSYGSAITYARRYALSAALGIAADEDDDGSTASKSRKASASPPAGEAPNLPSEHLVTPPVAADIPKDWDEVSAKAAGPGGAETNGADGEAASAGSAPPGFDPTAPATPEQIARIRTRFASAAARTVRVKKVTGKTVMEDLTQDEAARILENA